MGGGARPEHGIERAVAADPVPRRMNITKAGLAKYGFTAGRLGCRAWLTGRSTQGHSEECRRRLEKDMKDEPGLIVSKSGGNELFEKVLRKEDESQKRRKDT